MSETVERAKEALKLDLDLRSELVDSSRALATIPARRQVNAPLTQETRVVSAAKAAAALSVVVDDAQRARVLAAARAALLETPSRAIAIADEVHRRVDHVDMIAGISRAITRGRERRREVREHRAWANRCPMVNYCLQRGLPLAGCPFYGS